MPNLLTSSTRDRAAVLSELLLEAASSSSVAAALELARLCDPIDLDEAIACVDRALGHVHTHEDAIGSLRNEILGEARAAAGKPLASESSSAATRMSEGAPASSASLALSHVTAERVASSVTRRSTSQGSGALFALRKLGRELTEDVAALGMLRVPLSNQGWGECLGFEERLLASLDALVALGRPTSSGPGLDVVDTVVEYAFDWPVPDPGRIFAASLVLACSQRYAPLAAEIALARWTDERTLRALADGIALGSHPGLDAFVRGRILDETRPVLMALWVDVARRRRAVPADVLDLLAHPDPVVASAAVRAAVLLDPKESAPRLLTLLAAPSIVSVAAASALAVLGAQAGVQHLRLFADAALSKRVLDAHEETALEALALLGEKRDEKLFVSALENDERMAAVVVWHGSSAFLAPLLATVEKASSAVMKSVVSQCLARMVAPPGGSEIDGSPIDDEGVKARARALLTSVAPRLRHGAPHGPRAVLAELSDPKTTSGLRPSLALELSLGLKRPLALDAQDWIARQRLGLAELAADRTLGDLVK